MPLQLHPRPEVEETEDEGLVEVEWLPFELRPAPAALPEPRGEYIRDHWRDHFYGLAQNHGVEIHVSPYQPRSTLTLALHSFAEEQGRGRAYREAARRAFFVAGQDLGDEGVLRGVAKAAGLDEEAAVEAGWDLDRISALRSVREEALGSGCTGYRLSPREWMCSTTARRRRGRSTLCSPTGRAPAAWAAELLSKVLLSRWASH